MPNTMPNKSGEEFYRLYLAGDKSAFEELVKLYQQDLAVFIMGIVHDTHDTKHLVIEAFAELAVSSSRFMGKSSLKTYLFVIAKNLALAHLKKYRRHNLLSLDQVLEAVAGEDSSPSEFLEREENRARLRAVMEQLKPEHREVLLLLYFEDMSYAEAGLVMKKSVKQIADLAYRAKASLKKKLESEGFLNV